jgi:hypothetical protein
MAMGHVLYYSQTREFVSTQYATASNFLALLRTSLEVSAVLFWFGTILQINSVANSELLFKKKKKLCENYIYHTVSCY